MKTNREGMTFREWLNAAQCFGRRIDRRVAREAWERGEDPTEYAA